MSRSLKLLFKLRLTQPLRRVGFGVPWTCEEVEQEWFGGLQLHWNRNDVERAFSLATRIRGLEWVLGKGRDTTAFPQLPGIGRRGGFSEFLRVYWFGARAASIVGAAGAEKLMNRLITNDPDASEEATAIHLLRAGQPEIDLHVEPSMEVGPRKPDFRIRMAKEPWVYVEVTKLHSSNASTRVQELLARIADRIMPLEHPFILEIILNDEPTVEEEETIANEAVSACKTGDESRVTVTDVAAILVKSGDPSVAVPSPIPDDNRPRRAISRAIVGPGLPNRQLIVRVPFVDERAEDILRHEARQLPRNECGIVMVNVNLQPSAFESWSELIPQRFTPGQHTRVAAVILFMYATSLSEHGLIWVPYVKMIPNPHAAVPLPSWIQERVTCIRDNARRVGGHSD